MSKKKELSEQEIEIAEIEKKHVSNSDGSKIVKLKYPIRWGESELIETIKISPPKGKHLKGMQIGTTPPVETWLMLLSKISDQTLAVFEDMQSVDVFTCIEVAQVFLLNGPKIGKA